MDKPVSGIASTMSGVSVIARNKIQPVDPTSQVGGVLLNNCVGTIVEHNHIGTSFIVSTTTGTTGVTLQSCDKVVLAYNCWYLSDYCVGFSTDPATTNTLYKPGNLEYFALNVYTEWIDAGVGTKGIWKLLTPNTGWTNTSVSSTQLSYMKDEFNIVHLAGQVTPPSTTVATGTLIGSLPQGFWPNSNTAISGNNRVCAVYVNSSTTVSTFMALRILLAATLQGQIWVADSLTLVGYVSLDGITFNSSNV